MSANARDAVLMTEWTEAKTTTKEQEADQQAG
jgi:hypothetical protein